MENRAIQKRPVIKRTQPTKKTRESHRKKLPKDKGALLSARKKKESERTRCRKVSEKEIKKMRTEVTKEPN